MIVGLMEQARKFRFCGPSDDPDEQASVTVGYRDLVTKFKRLAGPILPDDAAARLNAITVEFDNLYSVFDASSEVEALLPDIEAALEHIDENGVPPKAREKGKPLPVPIRSVVVGVLRSYIYSRKALERMLYDAGAVGAVPVGNLKRPEEPSSGFSATFEIVAKLAGMAGVPRCWPSCHRNSPSQPELY